MTRDEAVEILRADNPRASLGDVSMYADAFLVYVEGSANIRAHGAIVAHPRTGAPMQNPYLPVVASAQKRMQALDRVRSVTRLWSEQAENAA